MKKVAIYTDGSCRFNPGPGGWGAVLLTKIKTFKNQPLETPLICFRHLAGYGGSRTTNNIMELTAIAEALKAIKDENVEIRIHTDSQYCIGVLSLGWNAKENKALISSIRKQLSRFPNLKFVKVKGHSGDRWNEEVHKIANYAVDGQSSIDEYDTEETDEKELF